MYTITEEDVRNIAAELTGGRRFAVSPLYEVMLKTSYRAICAKCRGAACLRGRAVEEDIFQDVYIGVWTHAYRVLFTDDGLNTDPGAFARWLAAVTNNRVRDYIRAASAQDVRTEPHRAGEDGEDEDPLLRVAAPAPSDERDRARELLCAAAGAVMGAGASVYIDLAWLAHALLVLAEGEERGRASRLVARRYGELSLAGMYVSVVRGLRAVGWLRLGPAALGRMKRRLLERSENGAVYGRRPFSSFFMKKGGEASVSDWVNRVNGRIRKKLQAMRKEDE